MKVLIIGNRDGTNIAGCFERAAPELRLDVRVVESRLATEAPLWLRRFNWWIRGRRPTWLHRFGRSVVELCRTWRPECVMTMGIAPLAAPVLAELGALGIRRLNYLTDDPWNPAHWAPWFVAALPQYDQVYSTRWANLHDLRRLGCRDVRYLPFAYAPELQYPDPLDSLEEQERFSSDIVFVGSGDRDRLPLILPLFEHGFRVGLYGPFWDRYPQTQGYSRGQADVRTLRKAIAGAKVVLCLVRRANRDGHTMRSFEIPAIGACMLTEDTEEHRELFGEEGRAVVYFSTIPEMITKLRWLLAHPQERQRLADAAHQLVTGGRHTYKDRLSTMLGLYPDEQTARERAIR